MNTIIIGIDIAKYKFDVAIIANGDTTLLQFTNNIKGFDQLLSKLPKAEAYRFIMEHTGNYGKALAEFLYNKGHTVSMLNPAQIRYYAKSKLVRSKTDTIDAIVIAEFAIAHPALPIFKPIEADIAKLRNLSRCLSTLKEDAAKIKTRIKAIDYTDVIKVYELQLQFLDKQIMELQNLLVALVGKNPTLQHNLQLLISIPGIGMNTAISLLAELPDLEDFKNAKQLSAFIGLNPSINSSGQSIRKKYSISKMGSNILRKILFLPAMVACRFNPILKAFANRLTQKGKNGKVVIIAVMRKLVHIIFAIIKKHTPFNPNHSYPTLH